MSEIQQELEKKGKASIEHFQTELSRMRTGRATTGLLEGIMVDYYGSQTPLNQLAMLNVPEPRLVTVQVYDAGAVEAVEKAIQQADLGLNPARDGAMIRVSIPALTEERRKDLAKKLGQVAEGARVTLRGHRREAIDKLKKGQKDKELTEDDVRRGEEEVQKITDRQIKEIDVLLAAKEKEVLEV